MNMALTMVNSEMPVRPVRVCNKENFVKLVQNYLSKQSKIISYLEEPVGDGGLAVGGEV